MWRLYTSGVCSVAENNKEYFYTCIKSGYTYTSGVCSVAENNSVCSRCTPRPFASRWCILSIVSKLPVSSRRSA